MINSQSIIAKLDELAEVNAAAALTHADYEARRAEILQTIQAELDALDVEFEPLLEAASERAEALEAEIKHDVLAYGKSIRGSQFHAVYTRGRVSWDTKGMDGYAAAHPEVLSFRKEGAPSIALRAIKDT